LGFNQAGQFLVRSETVDDTLWNEIVQEVHKDADHLFKIIGEAYNVLSDETKVFSFLPRKTILCSDTGV
jgi:DnaJ homolog subfamily C member 7